MEYRRFLRNGDYRGIISQSHLSQVSNAMDENKFVTVESDAEISVLEHLIENYEIEAALEVGKSILEYDPRIRYPKGVHFWLDDIIVRVTNEILGIEVPELAPHWEELTPLALGNYQKEMIIGYSQLMDFYTGDIVIFGSTYYMCIADNGYSFDNIRLPGKPIYWIQTLSQAGQEYDPTNLDYAVGDLVEFGGMYFVASDIRVNGDIPVVFKNVIANDPRNKNIRKHMARLALYELHKSVSPNNISLTVLNDWDGSMKWLENCNKLRINPLIDRRIDEVGRISTDWAISTFAGSTIGNNWMT